MTYVLPFHLDTYTFITTWVWIPLGFFGLATGMCSWMPAFLLSLSQLCPTTWGPLGPRIWTWWYSPYWGGWNQAWGARYPELGMEAHIAGEGPGRGPFFSGLRAALFTDALRCLQSTVTVKKYAAETETERDMLRLGLLVGIRCILMLAFSY